MPTDQGNGSQGQEPGAASPQNGQEPTAQQDQQQGQQGAGQQPQEGQQGHPQQFDPTTIQDPALRAVVEKIVRDAAEARQEAARYRTERTTLQEQVQQFQRQNETEQERVQREADERQQRLEALEAENRTLKVSGVVTAAASAAKAFDPETVLTLVQDRVELDDKGKPTNVDDLINQLKQDKPWMFQRTPNGADAGAGQGGGQGTGDGAPAGGINDLIRGSGRVRTR